MCFPEVSYNLIPAKTTVKLVLTFMVYLEINMISKLNYFTAQFYSCQQKRRYCYQNIWVTNIIHFHSSLHLHFIMEPDIGHDGTVSMTLKTLLFASCKQENGI